MTKKLTFAEYERMTRPRAIGDGVKRAAEERKRDEMQRVGQSVLDAFEHDERR